MTVELLPRCSYCGEHGVHGSADECLEQLRATVARLRLTQRIVIVPKVQYIPIGTSAWD